MGYYSQVKVITTKKGWKELEQAVEKTGVETDLMKCFVVITRGENEYVVGDWSDIKWYDWSDPAIGAFMDALRATHEPYRFMRVGEEYGDVEREEKNTEESVLPYLYLEQSIELE